MGRHSSRILLFHGTRSGEGGFRLGQDLRELEGSAEEKQENVLGPGNNRFQPGAKSCQGRLEEGPEGQCRWSSGVDECRGEEGKSRRALEGIWGQRALVSTLSEI